jgi:hypothetical protein
MFVEVQFWGEMAYFDIALYFFDAFGKWLSIRLLW